MNATFLQRKSEFLPVPTGQSLGSSLHQPPHLNPGSKPIDWPSMDIPVVATDTSDAVHIPRASASHILVITGAIAVTTAEKEGLH